MNRSILSCLDVVERASPVLVIHDGNKNVTSQLSELGECGFIESGHRAGPRSN